MTAYYNEFDPYAAQWLRNLIGGGHIAGGDVDERSILEVKADDIKGYTQCHFFAGIGGWSRALRLAGWADERPVWTGSCPCQPFSVAGKGKAQSDERHLWPAWFNLIKSVQPPVVFGEQVAGAIAHGWLDDAFDDLEREGYKTAACVLPACSVGAPHKRDRLWFVGNATERTRERNTGSLLGAETQERSEGQQHGHLSERFEHAGAGSGTGLMANANNKRSQGRNGAELQERAGEQSARQSSSPAPNPTSQGSFSSAFAGIHSREESAGPRNEQLKRHGGWESEPNVGRVANGVPARVGRLRAYGNAIVPQVAAEFIKAAMYER